MKMALLKRFSWQKLQINRRQFVRWSALSLGTLASFKSQLIQSLLFPKEKELKPEPTFSEFHHLSARILGVPPSSLSAHIAGQVEKELQRDPFYAIQLEWLSLELKTLWAETSTCESTEHFSTPARALATKLTQLWYTGVSTTKDGKENRLFYDEALMHAFYDTLRPAPGSCFGPFGYWKDSPLKPSQGVLVEGKSI